MDYKILENENVVINEKDGIHYLQFRKLLEYDNLMGHAFSIGRDLNFRTAPRTGQDFLPKDEMDRAGADYSESRYQERINAMEIVMASAKGRESYRNEINDIAFFKLNLFCCHMSAFIGD